MTFLMIKCIKKLDSDNNSFIMLKFYGKLSGIGSSIYVMYM